MGTKKWRSLVFGIVYPLLIGGLLLFVGWFLEYKQIGQPTVNNQGGNWLILEDGRQVYYRFRPGPDGSPVFLFNYGLGGASHIFDHLVPIVQKSAGVITYDRSGTGMSQNGSSQGMEDAVRIMDRLLTTLSGSSRIYLLGYSLGALYCAQYQMRHRQKLAGMILIDPVVLGADGHYFQTQRSNYRRLARKSFWGWYRIKNLVRPNTANWLFLVQSYRHLIGSAFEAELASKVIPQTPYSVIGRKLPLLILSSAQLHASGKAERIAGRVRLANSPVVTHKFIPEKNHFTVLDSRGSEMVADAIRLFMK